MSVLGKRKDMRSPTGGLADRVPQQYARVAADLDVVVCIAWWSRHRAQRWNKLELAFTLTTWEILPLHTRIKDDGRRRKIWRCEAPPPYLPFRSVVRENQNLKIGMRAPTKCVASIRSLGPRLFTSSSVEKERFCKKEI